MAGNSNITKFVLENVIDPRTGQYVDTDKIDSIIKSVYSSAKSAVNPDAFLSIREKVVDEATGHFYTEIFTDVMKPDALRKAINQRIKKLGGLTIGDPLPAQLVSGHKTFHSKEAMKLAMNDIIAKGGEFYHDPTALNSDRYAYSVPADPNIKINQKFKDSLFANNQSAKVENAYNTKRKNDADAKEAEKQKKAEEDENIRKQKEEEKERFKKAKEEAKARKDAEAEKLKKSEASKRTLKSTIVKIVAILTLVANITRRILSSLLANATQVQRDTLEANNLGVSYQDVRKARYAETALGMKEGVITGAMSDIQSMFGNITMIDEGALEKLALIMSSDIEELVRSGIGGSNPEQLLEMIVDAFNERANQGYNSVGQYVGEQQARRELYSLLRKVSPQIADIFARLNEAQNNPNSIYRNVTGYKDLIEATMPDRARVTDAESGLLYTLGELKDSVDSLFKQMKEAITIALSPTLTKLLEKIANSRLFMDDIASLALDIENREKNEAFITEMKSKKAEAEKDLPYLKGQAKLEQEAYIETIDDFINKAEKQNKKKTGVADVGATATEDRLRVLAGIKAKTTADFVLEGGDLFGDEDLQEDLAETELLVGREAVVSYLGGEEAYKKALDDTKRKYLGTAEGMMYRMNFSKELLTEAKNEAEIEQIIIDSISESTVFSYLLESVPALEKKIKKGVKTSVYKETQGKDFSSNITLPDDATIATMLEKAGKDSSSTYSLIGKQGIGKNSVYKIVLDINGNERVDNKDLVLFESEKGFIGKTGNIGSYSDKIVQVNATLEE